SGAELTRTVAGRLPSASAQEAALDQSHDRLGSTAQDDAYANSTVDGDVRRQVAAVVAPHSPMSLNNRPNRRGARAGADFVIDVCGGEVDNAQASSMDPLAEIDILEAPE